MLLESRLIKGKTKNYLISPDGVLITLAIPLERRKEKNRNKYYFVGGQKSLTHKPVLCSGYWKYSIDYAHRLVAKYFIPNPDNLPEVNHEDGNKLNNHYSNLKWVTSKQNHEHSHKVLGPQGKGHSDLSRKKRSISQKKHQDSLTPEERKRRTSKMIFRISPVVMFENGKIINYFVSIREAQIKTGIKNIGKKCKGLIEQEGPIIFKFGIMG